MIVLLPVGVAGPAGAPESPPASHGTPVTWTLVGVILLVAGLDLAAVLALRGWPVLPEPLLRAWLDCSVRLPLYRDPELFAPWQLWTAPLLHEGWIGRPGAWFFTLWQVVADTVVLVVAGRAIERRLGSAVMGALLLLLAPLAGLVHLRTSGPGALGTVTALAAGLAALAWALLAAHRLRATVMYWLVVAVGVMPFHLHLRWLTVGFVLLEAIRLGLGGAQHAHERALGLLAAVLIGFALGSGARWLERLR